VKNSVLQYILGEIKNTVN